MTKRIPWLTIAIAASFTVVIVFIGRSLAAGSGTTPNDKDKANATRVISPATDQRAELPSDGAYVGGNGVVEPAQPETKVATHVAGTIDSVLVKERDHVERGAPLVALEASVERATLAAAEADVATARATFARVSHGNRSEDVESALAEAASAKARAESSATSLTRTQALHDRGAATDDELDRARTAAAADAATLRSLEARAKAATTGSRYEDVAEARAKLTAAEARRDEAKAALDRLTIKAPIAGEVLRVKYRDGELYTPGGDPLVIIGDTNKLRVRIDINERDVARLRIGARGFATADAWKDKRFTGTVIEISRRFGRKNVRTDDPIERIDTKILEVVLELDDAKTLIPGQRVQSFVEVPTT